MPSYQLAISNIAWQKDDDETVYEIGRAHV